jgi:hypothetical protein
VVDKDSAIIGDARENRETIHADHIGMVKFSSRDDPGYKKVLNAIEMVLEGYSEDDDHESTNQSMYIVVHVPRISMFMTVLSYN